MDSRESLLQAGGPFDIVLADPPWRFASNSKDRPGKNPMAHYECMALDEIKALPVREIAARDALLLLWVTVPFAQQAWGVMEAWGFRYVSQMVWPKERIGTGFWVRNRHEIVYVARRGRFPCPRPAPFPDSVIPGPQREHIQSSLFRDQVQVGRAQWWTPEGQHPLIPLGSIVCAANERRFAQRRGHRRVRLPKKRACFGVQRHHIQTRIGPLATFPAIWRSRRSI